MSPLVSIVMVNYNKEKYIEDAIKSVLAQTYVNWELIIVDDGSTDRSIDIIKKYEAEDARIRATLCSNNRQICVATNIGFEQVRGEFVARLDSDDIWHPEKLEKQLRYMEMHPEGGLCFTKLDIINENGKIINSILPDLYRAYNSRRENQYEWSNYFFFYGNTLIQSSLLMKREVLDTTGGFNLAYMQAHDFDFFTRAIKEYKFIFLEEPLLLYRRTEEQNSNCNPENDRRFLNEHMNIRYHYFDNMSDDFFRQSFHQDFVNQESSAHEEFLCEQAFLLCKCMGKEDKNPILGLAKLEEIMRNPEVVKILEEKFDYITKDLYRQTKRHLFYTDELQNQINCYAYDVNVLRLLNENLEKKAAELDERCNVQERKINEMENSRSWRVTRPLRTLGKMMRKSK